MTPKLGSQRIKKSKKWEKQSVTKIFDESNMMRSLGKCMLNLGWPQIF